MSVVSTDLRFAADSDAVWERLLPKDLQSIIASAAGSSRPEVQSKKELYLRLSDEPILIEGGLKSFSIEKRSGKKCYMIAARALTIEWGDTPMYWKWISLPQSRFQEVAELISVCWFEIRGRINTCMLCLKTNYAAYLVFNSTTETCGFEYHPVEVSIGIIGGRISTQSVYLNPSKTQMHRYPVVSRRIGRFNRGLTQLMGLQASVPADGNYQYPKKREDGWLEIELGEFFNEGGYEELEMSVLEVKAGHWKYGLIIQGIEIRPKDRA
ncbi:hypothetical protein PVL29_004832 [Vitis rotundifolia]|nr:hypothetical protein PVL29_004832 [Vitis rotundifolia]